MHRNTSRFSDPLIIFSLFDKIKYDLNKLEAIQSENIELKIFYL